MISLEKFYFSFEEAEGTITGGSDGLDYHISFVPREEEGLHITLRMRGKDDFRKLMAYLTDLGAALLSDKDDNAQEHQED